MSAKPASRTVCVAHTDVGHTRDNNEDRFYATPDDFDPDKVRRLGRLYAVVDGMGGQEAGEVAAQIAVDTIAGAYYASTGTVEAGLRQAIQLAQAAIVAGQESEPKRANMGCALVLAVVHASSLTVANVGDCRAYLQRDGGMTILSVDHSWVAERVRAGVIKAEDAEHHALRSVLVRAMGQKDASSEPDVRTCDWRPGDRLLLCSDGLWDSLNQDQIASHMAGPFADAAKLIVTDADRLGGHDNITAVMVTERVVPAARAGTLSGRIASVLGIGLLAIAVGAVITLAVSGVELITGRGASGAGSTAIPGATQRATVTPFANVAVASSPTVETASLAPATPTLLPGALGPATKGLLATPMPAAPGGVALCHTSNFAGQGCAADFRNGLAGDQSRIYATWSPTATNGADFTIKWYKENDRSKVMEEIQHYTCSWSAGTRTHACKAVGQQPASDFATGSYSFVDNGDRTGTGFSPVWRVQGFPNGRYRFEMLIAARAQFTVDFAIVK